MKTALSTLVMTLVVMTIAYAQDVTTVQAVSTDISDNLDLEAVASIFIDADDLEDFERDLNDPESRISNLDLNSDGYVDYLRVIETAGKNAHLITIQAVIGEDMYQDIATIDVEQDEKGKTQVQVIGDVYMYGDNYIIEPIYVHRPRIFVYLWTPRIRPWCSTYYWGFYPSYWTYWNPYPYHSYWSHVNHYRHYSFHYRSYRRSTVCSNLSYGVRRNDYGHHHPSRSFAHRNDGYKNKREYDTSRGNPRMTEGNTNTAVRNAGRQVNSEWQTSAAREGRASKVTGNQVQVSREERGAKETVSHARTEKHTATARTTTSSERPSTAQDRWASTTRSTTGSDRLDSRSVKDESTRGRERTQSSSTRTNTRSSTKPSSRTSSRESNSSRASSSRYSNAQKAPSKSSSSQASRSSSRTSTSSTSKGKSKSTRSSSQRGSDQKTSRR